MAKLTVAISAYNAEKTIKNCLNSAKFADEIIFVDNGSNDATSEIAKTFTKLVFHQKNDPARIDTQKNFAIEKATGDWVMVLDSDEEITEELAKEIRKVIGQDLDINGYEMPRKNIIFGTWIEHTGWYPDLQLRLFKNGKGSYVSRHVHEKIQIEGSTGILAGHIMHHNYDSILQFLVKSLTLYAPNEAEEKMKAGYTLDYTDAVSFPFKEFLSRYFASEGYKDGFHGLMLSLLMSVYHFCIFAYLWEKNDFADSTPEDNMEHLKSVLKNDEKQLQYWVKTKKINTAHNVPIKYMLKLRRKVGI